MSDDKAEELIADLRVLAENIRAATARLERAFDEWIEQTPRS